MSEKNTPSKPPKNPPPKSPPKTPEKKPDPKGKVVMGPDGRPMKVIQMNLDLNKLIKNLFLILLLGFVIIPFIISLFGTGVKEITLSDFARDLQAGKISKIEVAGDQLRLDYHQTQDATASSTKSIVQKESGQTALDLIQAVKVDLTTINLEIKDVSAGQIFLEVLFSFLPLLLMFAFFFFLLRQTRGGGMDVFGIGKSKAKVFVKGKQNIKFSDVGGMTEAKNELEEIVDFLKNPKKYQKVGARTPKGVLLVGPAGTGKTLLARAVAGEAGVQFLSIAGSEFMEMLVGVGASRVRDLFDTAKKTAPSIIFIDEIDAIGRMRTGGGMSGHDEREQTLNQILVEMDGFSQNDNVIVMAATNRGDMLDPALIRPGRFDRRVLVNLPDLEELRFIINIHQKGKPFAQDVNWEQVAKMTTGFSGADLENMLNEAAITIVRDNRQEINLADLGEAAIKVKLGPSKKRLTDEYERKMTAYHEVGHAIVSHVLPHADPVSRISIISRGAALGYTITPPEHDKMQTTKSQMIDEMSVLLGGRVAEELIFNELTAGASNDIARATKIARKMVEEWGMSPLGPVYLAPQYEDSEYARYYDEPKTISHQLAAKVDHEVSVFIQSAYLKTQQILKQYRKTLDKISSVLLEKETLEGNEFAELMGEKKATTQRKT
jgi:cell division protease FtsH